MFRNRTRIMVILGSLAAGIYTGFILEYRVPAFMLICYALIQTYGYFRWGTVWLAWIKFERKDLSACESILAEIRRPGVLAKSLQGFYHFQYAGVELWKNGDYSRAEEHCRRALDIGIRTPNNKAIAHIMMAQICIAAHRRDEAVSWLERAKRIPHKAVLDNGIFRMLEELRED